MKRPALLKQLREIAETLEALDLDRMQRNVWAAPYKYARSLRKAIKIVEAADMWDDHQCL